MDIEYYKERLEKAGVVFESGLTENEVVKAETFYDFRFPPDLKEFLMFALPVSSKWINWRELGSDNIKGAFDWIYEGFYFDIEHNDFWLENWGEKPKTLQGSFSIAKQKIGKTPKLIPIRGHRYIPASPNEINNPIFSVYQTDIVYYGNNIWDYFEKEFPHHFQTLSNKIEKPIKQIKFWSLFAEELI